MIKAEALAQWYFRLNGFLTIPNFILHRPGGQRTEVDVIGVRFPHRSELTADKIDEPEFRRSKPYLVLAEAKTNRIDLNRPWVNPEGGVIEDILKAVGVHGQESIPSIAQALREVGEHENSALYTSLCFVGDFIAEDVRQRFRQVPSRSWDDVLRFIHNRFTRFDRFKTQVDQWDDVGRELWRLWLESEDYESFARKGRRAFYLRQQPAV